MLKPLYLDGAVAWAVTLDSSVALKISGDGLAVRRFPLRRLARVISSTRVNWSTEALVACLSAGVPVMFRDFRGNPVGWCYGGRRREATLGQLLREGVGQPEFPDWFGDWRRAMDRREALGVLDRLHATWACTDLRAARTALFNLHRQRTGQPAGALFRACRSATACLVAEHLSRAVEDPELIAYARPGLHLTEVILELAEWSLHEVLAEMPADCFHPDQVGRSAAAAIERPDTPPFRAVARLICDLELALREWLL